MFELTIECGNAAFRDGESVEESTRMEIVSILQDVKHEIRQGKTSGTVKDTNGNQCGEWSLKINTLEDE